MRLIDANELVDKIHFYDEKTSDDRWITSDIEYLVKEMPTIDAVSRGVYDQVRWERDIAIAQLESYGVSFGEKADVVKVVRCKDCKHTDTDGCGAIYCEKWDRWEMPEDFFCSYGERKDNE